MCFGSLVCLSCEEVSVCSLEEVVLNSYKIFGAVDFSAISNFCYYILIYFRNKYSRVRHRVYHNINLSVLFLSDPILQYLAAHLAVSFLIEISTRS